MADQRLSTDDLIEELSVIGRSLTIEWDTVTTLWVVVWRVQAATYIATDATLHAALFDVRRQSIDEARNA